MRYQDLKTIADSVGALHGWDFSRMRTDRDPVPWDYAAIVRGYLRATDHVLDIATGGGEQFLALASAFERGIGIDIDAGRLLTARANIPTAWRDRISLQVMDTHNLRFADATFDVVLNRHAPIAVGEISRVLKPGGYFITQQVATGNMANLAMEFGSPLTPRPTQQLPVIGGEFEMQDCRIVAHGMYDVHYFVQDVASLIFWLKAVCNPDGMNVAETFDIEKHWPVLDRIINRYQTSRGIQTNERRELLIVQKRPGSSTPA